jgi:hypothetical protein
MRDLTMYELDAQLAEQLPARELMQTAVSAFNINVAVAINTATVTQTSVFGNNYSSIDQVAAAAAGNVSAG